MSLLKQTAKRLLTVTLPPRLLLVRGRRRRDSDWADPSQSDQVRISLTFDDGPHPEYTPRLLDRLAAAGASGTFFVVGEKVMRYSSLLTRMVNEGHEVGNHTFRHADPAQTTAEELLREVNETRELIACLVGCNVHLVRPPKGALTLAKLLGLWGAGQTVVLWNVDPKDFQMKTVLELDRWLKHYRPSDGDIVLLHDTGPLAELVVRELTDRERFPSVRFVPVSYWLGEQKRDCRQTEAAANRGRHETAGAAVST